MKGRGNCVWLWGRRASRADAQVRIGVELDGCARVTRAESARWCRPAMFVWAECPALAFGQHQEQLEVGECGVGVGGCGGGEIVPERAAKNSNRVALSVTPGDGDKSAREPIDHRERWCRSDSPSGSLTVRHAGLCWSSEAAVCHGRCWLALAPAKRRRPCQARSWTESRSSGGVARDRR